MVINDISFTETIPINGMFHFQFHPENLILACPKKILQAFAKTCKMDKPISQHRVSFVIMFEAM